jgi:hypothetical protein
MICERRIISAAKNTTASRTKHPITFPSSWRSLLVGRQAVRESVLLGGIDRQYFKTDYTVSADNAHAELPLLTIRRRFKAIVQHNVHKLIVTPQDALYTSVPIQ